MTTTGSDFQTRRAAVHAQIEELKREQAAAEAHPELLEAVEAGREVPKVHANRIDAIGRQIQLCGVALRQIDQAEALAGHQAAIERAARGESELSRLQVSLNEYSATFDTQLDALCKTWRSIATLAEKGRAIADEAGFHREAWYGLEEDRLRGAAIEVVLHALRWKAELIAHGTTFGDVPGQGSVRPLGEVLRDGATCYIPRSSPPEAA